MTQESREKMGNLLGNLFTPKDLLKGIMLLVMLVGGYFSLVTRITILETQRAEDRQSTADKIKKIEDKVDKATEKLDEVNTNIKVVQSQLNDYGPNTYVYRPYKNAPSGTVRKY